jgi:predicted nucleotidyltransferase
VRRILDEEFAGSDRRPGGGGEDRDDSVLDLLADLPTGALLLAVVVLQQDLADTLGVPVDLLTEREIDPGPAPQIIAQARPL